MLSILISVSAINAADDNASMNAIKTSDNTQDLISTQDVVQKDSVKSAVKLENKNTKNIEKTAKENNKIKKEADDSTSDQPETTTKKDIADIDAIETPVFDDTPIDVTLEDTDGKNVTETTDSVEITVNEKTYTTEMIGGAINYTIPTNEFAPGEYDLVITIPETTDYNAASLKTTLTIIKRTINETVPAQQTTVYNDTNVNITLKDTQNDTLTGDISATVAVNDEEATPVTIKNGSLVTTVATKTLAPGEYNLVINVPKTEYYNAATIKTTLTVNKRNINTTVPAIESNVFDNTNVDVTIKDMFNDTLTGDIDASIAVNGGISVPVKIENGVIKTELMTSSMNPGKYVIAIYVPATTNYNAATVNADLTINKRNITESINSLPAINAFENITIKDTLTDAQDETLKGEIPATITVGDLTVPITIKDGVIDTPIATETLAPGAYLVTINIPESANYNAASIKTTLTVNKRNINAVLPSIKTPVFNNTPIEVTLKDAQGETLKGTVDAKIHMIGKDMIIDTTIVDGVLNVTLPTDTFTPGTYEIVLFIPDSTNYNTNSTSQNISIIKRTINTTTVLPPNINAAENTSLPINVVLNDTLNDTLQGEIPAIVKVGNITNNVTIKDGILDITIPTEELKAGNYVLTISMPATQNYNAATIKTMLVMSKRTINTTVPPVQTTVFENTTIDVVLNDTLNETLKGEINATVVLGNITNNVTIKDGVLNTIIPTDTLKPGAYTIKVNIPATGIYNAATININLTINERSDINTTIPKIPVVDVFTNATVDVTLTDSKNKTLEGTIDATIKVDGKDYNVAIKDGVLNTTIPTDTLASGVYDVVIDIPQSTKYNAATIKTSLTINKIDIQNVTLPNSTVEVKNNYTIVAEINDTNGNILKGEIPATVTLNGEEISTVINNGLLEVELPTSFLNVGNYSVNITIPENDYYNAANITTNIAVIKLSVANITLENATIKTGNNYTIFIVAKDTNGNLVKGNLPVAIKLNGVTQLKVRMIDGILNATLNTDKFTAKTYSITILMGDNEQYNQGIAVGNLTIENQEANITIMDVNTPKTTGQLQATVMVTDNDRLVNGGYVIFKINGVTQKDANGNAIRFNVVNGFANINYTLPSTIGAGDYKLLVIYGNPLYTSVRNTTDFSIVRSTIENKTFAMTQNKGENLQLNIIVNDTEGNQIQGNTKVCVKINGVTYAHDTITNGVLNITVPTDKLGAKTYNVTIILGKGPLYDTAVYSMNLTVLNAVQTPTLVAGDNSTIAVEN
ncbi:hypothetical protein [Methanosphaera cuniculi]|uniref:hypothetical protein n=1 Tax=Methanosphaera cuniculi TaxID=1077256 RepID=UPI0026F2D691|nr:hypothetical protein [Methanosphaera cuniculi]